MKITVLKQGGGSIIDFSKDQGHNAEEIKDILLFLAQDSSNEITYYGHVKSTYSPKSNIKLVDCFSTDSYDLDNVFLINGSINFFGGAEAKYLLKIYELTARAKKLTYYFVDTLLPLETNIWKIIEKKKWSSKYKYLENINFTDNINVITHYYNHEFPINKSVKHRKLSKENVHYFPMYKYQYNWGDQKLIKEDNFDCDVCFGGSLRTKIRTKAISNYLVHQDLYSVDLYGTINEKDFNKKEKIGDKVNFKGKVSYQELLIKNNCALSTVLIEDLDCDKLFTGRIGQSPLSATLLLVHTNCDPKKILFPEYQDFLYFSNIQELSDKVEYLKNNLSYRRDLILYQIESMKNTREEIYNNYFKKVIE